MKVAFTILGEPASKANSRELVTIPRWSPKLRKKVPMAASIKSKKALAYEAAALLQIPQSVRVMMTGDVRVTMTIYYASRRPDLDESVVLDVIQAKFAKNEEGEDLPVEKRALLRAGVYLNDRQVREKHITWALDPTNPRAVIEVEEIHATAALFDLPPPQPLARLHRAPAPQPMPEKPF